MNNLLLLGAGFSRNWGGRLASEVRSDLQFRLRDDAYLTSLLQRHDFETVLSTVQNDYTKRATNETEEKLRVMQSAIVDVFDGMNRSFKNRPTIEFGNDMSFRLQPYLSRFDAIFTLNQDLLLELHYRRDDPSVWHNTKWNGYCIPGMAERRQHDAGPYDLLQSRWYPSGDFKLEPRDQPFIKLHGSSNWETEGAQPMLVMGSSKLSQINQLSILKRYFDFFIENLSQPDTRLVVIGYGFADEHVNRALLDAGRNGTMRMFVVHPSGRGILVRNPGAMIPPPEPLRDDIPSLGESIRPLSQTFSVDDIERDAFYKVLT